MKKYKTDFSKEELHAALHANDNEAIAIIEDAGRWTKFIEKFEAFAKKAEKIPVLGGMIDDIVCMAELADSYVKKDTATSLPERSFPSLPLWSICLARSISFQM